MTLLSHGYDGVWLTLWANDQLELIAAMRKFTLSHSHSSHQVNSVISHMFKKKFSYFSLAGFIDLLGVKETAKVSCTSQKRIRCLPHTGDLTPWLDSLGWVFPFFFLAKLGWVFPPARMYLPIFCLSVTRLLFFFFQDSGVKET